MIEKLVSLENISLVDFLGPQNQLIQRISAAFPNSKIVARGDQVKLKGSIKEVSALNELFFLLVEHFHRYGAITEDILENYLVQEKHTLIDAHEPGVLLYGAKGISIKPRTPNQKKLIDAANAHDLVFAVGPAGTGKTYVAVALAVYALKNKLVNKIIITRPAVEAGENLGFLPGDLKDKVDPYLRPIYDALDDMLPAEKLALYKEQRIIEIAPLAYMRGRTLSNAFVLLDEAQNTTPMQMKMFLTRLGQKSKMIITGDVTQIDLPTKQASGLVQAVRILKNVKEVAIIELKAEDVVRHKLVKKIIDAYDKEQDRNA